MPNANSTKYPVFEQLKQELQGYDLDSVSEIAEVSKSTLYFWLEGRTKSPQIRTLTNVAQALGFDILIKRNISHKRAERT